jgi:cytochrome c biogenesis protein CcmG/thiol:disulfide interchange protein DsbE
MSHKPPKGSPLGQSRVQAARSGPRIPLFALALGALAVVLIAAVVGVVAFGGDDSDTGTLAAGDQAFGPVTATGTPLEEYDDQAGEDPAVGQPAPTLEGETPSGEPITIDPSEGPMVVAFLAHWCPHCQAEVPRIVELADGSDEIEGVPFAAVLTASDPTLDNFPPGEWLAREDWPAPAMVDTEPESGSIPVAFSTYGVSGYPFLVAIDADGNVAARSSGELGDDGLREFFAQVSPDT